MSSSGSDDDLDEEDIFGSPIPQRTTQTSWTPAGSALRPSVPILGSYQGFTIQRKPPPRADEKKDFDRTIPHLQEGSRVVHSVWNPKMDTTRPAPPSPPPVQTLYREPLRRSLLLTPVQKDPDEDDIINSDDEGEGPMGGIGSALRVNLSRQASDALRHHLKERELKILLPKRDVMTAVAQQQKFNAAIVQRHTLATQLREKERGTFWAQYAATTVALQNKHADVYKRKK